MRATRAKAGDEHRQLAAVAALRAHGRGAMRWIGMGGRGATWRLDWGDGQGTYPEPRRGEGPPKVINGRSVVTPGFHPTLAAQAPTVGA